MASWWQRRAARRRCTALEQGVELRRRDLDLHADLELRLAVGQVCALPRRLDELVQHLCHDAVVAHLFVSCKHDQRADERRNARAWSARFEMGAQAAFARGAQLAERVAFELPGTFAREREAGADLFERALAASADAEAQAQDLRFALR